MQNDLISRSALLKKKLVPPGNIVLLDDIENAPAVDAVEVVRCGNFNHRMYIDCGDGCVVGGCPILGMALPYDFYCRFGERRADDGTP